MPANSNASSTEARNGSAYSQSAHEPDFESNLPYPGASTTQARCPGRTPYPGSATLNQNPVDRTRLGARGYQYMNGNHTNGIQPKATSPDETNQVPERHAESHAMNQIHNNYALDITYGHELVPEDGQLGTGTANHGIESRPYQHGGDATSQASEQGYHVQHNGQMINQEYPPATRRWSAEYSPEERLRLGLPRWESEQHRLAYERGSRS